MDTVTWEVIGSRNLPSTAANSAHSFPTAGVVMRNDRRTRDLRQNDSLPSPQTTSENPGAKRAESGEKVKTKLISMWNNVKYGWTVRVKTSFSREAPVWFLGQCYDSKMVDRDRDRVPMVVRHNAPPSAIQNCLVGFKEDFVSRIWLTYRREFATLAGSSLTTDCGWGCMLRSGQMMLAQALLVHFLSRSWRWCPLMAPHEEVHRQIVRWFGDFPDEMIPFSLHKLVAYGENSGKKAGDWYGPASVAHIVKQAVEKGATTSSSLREVCVYVAQDCTVYKQDVLDLCCSGAQGQTTRSHQNLWTRSVIILVPVRLGGDSLNSIYVDCMKTILSNEHSIGIIGGKPKHSLYFVGWQEDKMIHLDPHYCQEIVDVREHNFPLQSFHCPYPRKMGFHRMDPSCTLGFYCNSPADLERFFTSCQEVLAPLADYPMFVVASGRGEDQHESLATARVVSSYSTVSTPPPDSDDFMFTFDPDEEEFVFL